MLSKNTYNQLRAVNQRLKKEKASLYMIHTDFLHVLMTEGQTHLKFMVTWKAEAKTWILLNYLTIWGSNKVL